MATGFLANLRQVQAGGFIPTGGTGDSAPPPFTPPGLLLLGVPATRHRLDPPDYRAHSLGINSPPGTPDPEPEALTAVLEGKLVLTSRPVPLTAEQS